MNMVQGSHFAAWAAGLCLSALVACGGSNSPDQIPPAITAQPQNQTVTAPATATFAVTATGNPMPVYQWNLAGNAIPGATAASFTTPATTVAMSGNSYTVTVSNGVGSPVTSTAAILTVNPPALSQDQQTFEGFSLAPNTSYECYIDLPYTGSPVSGTNYFTYTTASLAASPSLGAQTVTSSARGDLAQVLPVPGGYLPDRYLVNGQILLSSAPTWIRRFSYPAGSVAGITGGVQVELLDSTGATVVASYINNNYSVVALGTGTIVSAPSDLVNEFSPLFYNATLLNATLAWNPADSAYEKFTSTFINDTYFIFDYATTQTANIPPLPVATNTTLATLMGNGGIQVGSDGIRYTSSLGTIATRNGVTTYVATSPRPNGPTYFRTTPAYITFYELQVNGVTNVYLGEVIKAGTVSGGNPFAPSGWNGLASGLDYTMAYQIRLNHSAVTSFMDGVTF